MTDRSSTENGKNEPVKNPSVTIYELGLFLGFAFGVVITLLVQQIMF